MLGTKYAGLGGLHAVFKPDLNKESFMKGLDEVNAICEGFKKYGLKFTYHHHACEFAKFANESMMDILMREMLPNSSFVLDTYWLQHAGANVLEWIDKLAGRVDILHLKDKAVAPGTNDGHITELGNGNMNFKEIIRVAEASGVEHLCYEQDNGFTVNCLDSAKKSAEFFYSII